MVSHWMRSAVLCSTVSVWMATPARTQELATGPGDQAGIEDIVVTAQRKAERAQNVPISISAFTGAQLESKHIEDVASAITLTPGVTTQETYSPFDLRVQIRGISEKIPSLGIDPPVGIYVDEVYYALTAGANTQTIDVASVEVLKGPQGTLFGRNTIGGALNITTNKPTDKLEGFIEGELGNYDTYAITGVLNVPITSDTVAARLVFQHREHSGYGRNTYLDSPLADLNQNYVRGMIKIDPAPDWQILLSANYLKADLHATPIKLNYIDTSNAFLNYLPYANQLPTYVGGDPYTTQGFANPKGYDEVYGGTATISGRLGEVSVKSITNYTHIDQNNGSDQTGAPFPLLYSNSYLVRGRQFSQEIHASGNLFDSHLDWIAGLYYFRASGVETFDVTAFQPLLPPLLISDHDVTNKSYAAFAQFTYHLTPDIRLTGGVRYTRDERAIVYRDRSALADGTFLGCSLANTTPTTTQAACVLPYKAAFNYVPWTAGIDYKPSANSLIYAKVSRGYRSGGYSLSGPTPGATPADTADALHAGNAFGPESLLSPEVGAKFAAFRNRLRLNAAAFYSDYTDIQQSTNLVATSGTVLAVTQNVGRAHLYGVELDSEVLIGRLKVDAGLALTESDFIAGPFVGSPLLFSPKTSFSIGLEYPVDVKFATLTLNSDYSWRSDQQMYELDKTNQARNRANQQPAYGLLSARASLAIKDLPLTISAWVTNLTDKRYKVQTADLVDAFGFVSEIVGLPRTFGATGRFNF